MKGKIASRINLFLGWKEFIRSIVENEPIFEGAKQQDF